MLYAMLAACAILTLVLAVSRAAEARRLARLFRAQEEWARDDGPPRVTSSAMPPGGPVARPARWGRRIVPPAEGPALAVLLSVIYLFPGEPPPLTASCESEPPAARAITENRPTAV